MNEMTRMEALEARLAEVEARSKAQEVLIGRAMTMASEHPIGAILLRKLMNGLAKAKV
jgi:uncharacterized coiled-coil protein SlyX